MISVIVEMQIKKYTILFIYTEFIYELKEFLIIIIYKKTDIKIINITYQRKLGKRTLHQILKAEKRPSIHVTLYLRIFQGIDFVAMAMGHVTGPFTTTSDNKFLILMKRLLNSSPHPFDNRKSSNILPSISTTFALNTSCNFRRSMVDMVIWWKEIKTINMSVTYRKSRDIIKSLTYHSTVVNPTGVR